MAESRLLAKFVLSFETSKYTNNPNDRGGATKYGVTLNTWKKVGYDKNNDGVINAEDVRLLTEDDYLRVFRQNFWNVCWGDLINDQSIANLLVDFAYCSGARRAIRYIQSCLNVGQDGIMGPGTITAINSYGKGARSLFDALKIKRIAFLNAIVKNDATQQVNLKGWMRRVGNIQYGKLIASNGKEL